MILKPNTNKNLKEGLIQVIKPLLFDIEEPLEISSSEFEELQKNANSYIVIGKYIMRFIPKC